MIITTFSDPFKVLAEKNSFFKRVSSLGLLPGFVLAALVAFIFNEVSFDIDVNGILLVKAKDKNTGAEQSISITGSSKLDDVEIDRMVEEAEAFSQADKEKRESVDLRNEADSLCYQSTKQLESLDATLEESDKAKVNSLVAEVRSVMDSDNLEELKVKTKELQELMATLISNIPDQDASNPSNGDDDQSIETEIN